MNKRKLLEDLRYNKRLLSRYEKKILSLKDEYVADVVKDYSRSAKGIPLKIEGYNTYSNARLKALYLHQIAVVSALIEQAERVIADTSDPIDKLILSLRYVDGLTLQEVADNVGYSLAAVKVHIKRAID